MVNIMADQYIIRATHLPESGDDPAWVYADASDINPATLEIIKNIGSDGCDNDMSTDDILKDLAIDFDDWQEYVFSHQVNPPCLVQKDISIYF
jgi:hypothetical protein